jgi:hypothetical protein
MREDARGSLYREEPAGEQPGRPRSWVPVGIAIAALYAGGVAVIVHQWALFWACAGLVVLAVPVGRMIGVVHDIGGR